MSNEGGSSKGALIAIGAIVVVVLLVAGLGAYFLTRGGDDENTTAAGETSTSEGAEPTSAGSSSTSAEAPGGSGGASNGGAEATGTASPGQVIDISVEADGPVDLSFYLPEGDTEQDNATSPVKKSGTLDSAFSYNSVLIFPHDYNATDFDASCTITIDGRVVAENHGSLSSGSVICSYTTSK